ncbi:hypothetical protein STEG23_001811 [Scotinomys teguina]
MYDVYLTINLLQDDMKPTETVDAITPNSIEAGKDVKPRILHGAKRGIFSCEADSIRRICIMDEHAPLIVTNLPTSLYEFSSAKGHHSSNSNLCSVDPIHKHELETAAPPALLSSASGASSEGQCGKGLAHSLAFLDNGSTFRRSSIHVKISVRCFSKPLQFFIVWKLTTKREIIKQQFLSLEEQCDGSDIDVSFMAKHPSVL